MDPGILRLLMVVFAIITISSSTSTSEEEDGLVEVEEDSEVEVVIQVGDRLPTEEELRWRFVREYGHSEEEWYQKKKHYDADHNGHLDEKEFVNLVNAVIKIDNSNQSWLERLGLSAQWLMAYTLTGLAAVYMVYSMCHGPSTQIPTSSNRVQLTAKSRLLREGSSFNTDSLTDSSTKKAQNGVEENRYDKRGAARSMKTQPEKTEIISGDELEKSSADVVPCDVSPPEGYNEADLPGSGDRDISSAVDASGCVGHERAVSVEEILSDVLNIQLVVDESSGATKWSMTELRIRKTELPYRMEDVATKCHVLWEKRLSREVLLERKLSLCALCWNRCASWSNESMLTNEMESMLDVLQKLSVHEILSLLDCNDEAGDDEDDLWADVASSVSPTSHVSHSQEIRMEFLLKLSGYCEDQEVICDSLLGQIFQQAKTGDKRSLLHVVHSVGSVLKQVPRHDELGLVYSNTLKGLQLFLSKPQMLEIIAEKMAAEICDASASLGVFFEKESFIGPLMAVSPVPSSLRDIMDLRTSQNQPWTSLRGFPSPGREEVRSLETQVGNGLHSIQETLFQLFRGLVKRHREDALAWLSCLVSVNELRTSVQPVMNVQQVPPPPSTCSDGFMLNLLPVLLELCMPFCQPGDLTKLEKVIATYCASQACRINYDLESCLAGGQIVREESDKQVLGALSENLRGTHNFMTEIFHITLRALNIGFFPALSHFNKVQGALVSNLKQMDKASPMAEDLRSKHLVFALRWDVALLDVELLRKTSLFYLAVSQWLRIQLKSCQNNIAQEKRLFSQIPEFIVKDIGQWFWFLASHGLRVHPNVVSGIDLYPMVDCCVLLLRRPDLVPGPLPAYRITRALLAFVKGNQQQQSPQQPVVQGWGSGALSGLASIVHTCPAVQTDLGPALIHTYTAVDVVEGLDVDKEEFDKYTARGEIGMLIENLWGRADCRQSILALSTSSEFQGFLGAILDTLLYQLHDSLARLANVKTLQQAQADESNWVLLSAAQQEEKKKFLGNEERVALGFMSMARSTLGLLELLTQSDQVTVCFSQARLAQRASSAFIGFLEALCGHKAADLKVKDMEKYNFDPKQLLHLIVDILLRISSQESAEENNFTSCLAMDAEFNETTINKALSVVKDRIRDGNMAQTFETLIEKLLSLRSSQAAGTSRLDADSIQSLLAELDQTVVDNDSLEREYSKYLGTLSFDAVDLLAHHSFQVNAAHQTVDPRSSKCKALLKEVKLLMSELPVHPHAAIFVRQDEEQMDVMRALVTGQTDTPYSRGCFVFDVYFPQQYPNVPPLVRLITTGNGNIRFNPNLYADGKVCLSLLGTWHSGDSSQKWQPNSSNLYQVLMSIQSLILIADPMFNEPGYEGIRDTEEGEAKSLEYNTRLQIHTIRHSMLGQLQQPPAGFEAVIRRHFSIQRAAILRQCAVWLRGCRNVEDERRMRRAVQELREVLNTLPDPHTEEEQVDDDN